MYIILAFLQPVCACTVAKEQNRRICKNIVLMATRFHSTSGFNLSPLIGENVTISVSLWIQKERRPPASCYSSQSTSSTAIKNSFADACACAYTPSKSGGARSVEFLSMGKFFFLSKTHLAHYDRVISNEVFITESQVFNMSHISRAASAKRPLDSKLHLAK